MALGGVILLVDLTAIITVAAVAPAVAVPQLVAVAASLTRISLTAPQVRRILAGR